MGKPGRSLGSTPEWGTENLRMGMFGNQSQQDLLMNGTWGMRKGESCHARLQVSGLSTWVDGGAFSQDRGMRLGEEQTLEGRDIKILLQKT